MSSSSKSGLSSKSTCAAWQQSCHPALPAAAVGSSLGMRSCMIIQNVCAPLGQMPSACAAAAGRQDSCHAEHGVLHIKHPFEVVITLCCVAAVLPSCLASSTNRNKPGGCLDVRSHNMFVFYRFDASCLRYFSGRQDCCHAVHGDHHAVHVIPCMTW
jgi:hypothetical protein